MTIPGRIGVVLRDPLPWDQLIEAVETAEETGYEAVFVPESGGREAFATLAGFSGATSRVRLGSGVVTVGSRTPTATAMGAATVQDLSGGRMILGLGAGDPGGRTRYSGPPSLGPVELVERYALSVSRILAGEEVEEDTVFGTPHFKLALPVEAGPPPIWLGAVGDRMVSLAGRVADGVILNWCTPQRVTKARGLVDRALQSIGRDPSEFTLAVYLRACLGVPEKPAIAALQVMAGQYAAIAHYRRQMEEMGLGTEAGAAARAFEAGRPQDVPSSLVRALTVSGGRTEALTRFQAFFDAGADLVLCYPVSALEPLSSILGTILAAAPHLAVER